MTNRDLPDPLGWADVANHPEETARVIRARGTGGRLPQRAHPFPLPKPFTGAAARKLLQLDHLDDLTIRIMVGRLIAQRRHLYNANVVLSNPVVGRGPGWRIADARGAHNRRRREGMRLLSRSRSGGMGITDTSDYYGSVDSGILTEQLLRAGCRPGAVDGLAHVLNETAQMVGVPGLPIGSEGSAFLGNAYLSPADAAFDRRSIPELRWTDDVWSFPDSESQWQEALGDYRTELAGLKLRTNEDKTHFLSRLPARRKIQNPVVDYLLSTGGGGGVTATQAFDTLAEMLYSAEFSGEDIDPTGVRFGFGVFRSQLSTAGIELLEVYPEVLDQEPTACGRYLVTMGSDPSCRRRLDRDWLIDPACRRPTAETLAGSVQSIRVLSHLHLSESLGDQLFDLATSQSLAHHVPLQQWAAHAWQRSEHWKLGRAGDAAESSGHLLTKRSFTAGLRRGRGSSHARRCLDHLLLQEPDLAPTVAWAR